MNQRIQLGFILWLALTLSTSAQTNQYGSIYENDGTPTDLGNGQVGWTYAVVAGSFGNITTIRLENFFSATTPTKISLPSLWTMTATRAGSSNLWNLQFQTSDPDSYIGPNGTANFNIKTYSTPTTHTLLTGPRPGAVMFQGDGHWYSPDVSGLIGPVGEVPTNAPPLVPGLSGLGLGAPGVSLTATNLAWGYGYTLERSADLRAWTNLLTFPATNATQLVNFPLPASAPSQFFRLRSP